VTSAVVAVRRRLAALQAPEATAFLAPSLVAWRRWMAALVAAAFAYPLLVRDLGLTELFFYGQDLPAAILMLVAAQGLYLVPAAWAPAAPRTPGWRAALALALAVAAAGWAGSRLVYDGYGLSMDEFMARFDAQILAGGRLAASIPEAWRAYAAALQPKFAQVTPDHAHWVSTYLPVNAALLALGLRIGAEALAPALLAGIAVAATFGCARRLWPDRPAAAWAAAVLLATAPQLLITAMTPYSMTAHLALNMAWLWLVLRGGKAGHGAAAGVAFLATGLHQLIFNPLFAAPFVADMWLARRWKAAAWHTAAYAAIGLFWAAYPGLVRHAFAGPAAAGPAAAAAAAGGGQAALAQALALIRGFQPLEAPGFMLQNIVRFLTWQSLLAVPLAFAAAWPALRQGGMVRALVASLVLTTLAMLLLMPYQGHGWGYRYLHGLMGALALLAGFGWSRIGEGAEPRVRAAVFAAAAAASLAVLFPLRAWQTWTLTHPHARAERQIRAVAADIVLVDANTLRVDIDSVRNRPDLSNRPLEMYAPALTPAQVRALCARYRLRWVVDAPAGVQTADRCG